MAGLAWALWALAMLGLAAVPVLDGLLRRAGRADLVQLTPDTAGPVLAVLSGAVVGVVLANRRPRHPVGWLLLALAVSLAATAAAAQYLVWGLLVRPGALPAAGLVALCYPTIGFAALTSVGFVLLLTPTGSLPSPHWRWWARAMVVVPIALLMVATLAGGPLDPRYQALGGPFDLRGLAGVPLLANRVALAVTTLGLVVAAVSVVWRYRLARGVERLQLRWVAFAAGLGGLACVVVLAALALGVPHAMALFVWVLGACLAVQPVAIGAAVLRYRLYDLDRIISRTLTYAVVSTMLLVVYGLVVALPSVLFRLESDLLVAAATLTAAAAFVPVRRRVQAAVDRRFNRARYDAVLIVDGFGARLRQDLDLDGLVGDLRDVVATTMGPAHLSLWLRDVEVTP